MRLLRKGKIAGRAVRNLLILTAIVMLLPIWRTPRYGHSNKVGVNAFQAISDGMQMDTPEAHIPTELATALARLSFSQVRLK